MRAVSLLTVQGLCLALLELRNGLAVQPRWGQSGEGLKEASLVPRACGFTRSFWEELQM